MRSIAAGGSSQARLLRPESGPDEFSTRAYEQMAWIRAVEMALLDLFERGRLRGTVHTCVGQEAVAVGVVEALDRERDVICSNHRGHGHFLAWCGDARGLVAEIMGRAEGVCGGIGGSQHLHARNFLSNGILGGMLPIAAGIALAEQRKQSGAVTAVFCGDGALGEGVVYESFNLAAQWRLPLLVVVEHNGWAQSTPTERQHAGDLARRAEPFGIAIREADGNDVLEVHRAACAGVAAIRDGAGPQLLFLRTWRLGPHSKGEDERDPEEVERRRSDEPLLQLRERLDPAWCDEADLRAEAQAAQLLESFA